MSKEKNDSYESFCNFSSNAEYATKINEIITFIQKKQTELNKSKKAHVDKTKFIREIEQELNTFNITEIKKNEKTYNDCLENLRESIYGNEGIIHDFVNNIFNEIQNVNTNKQKEYIEQTKELLKIIESLRQSDNIEIIIENIYDLFKKQTEYFKYLTTIYFVVEFDDEPNINELKILITEYTEKIDKLLETFKDTDKIKKKKRRRLSKFSKCIEKFRL